MGKILQHFEAMGNHRLLGNHHSRVYCVVRTGCRNHPQYCTKYCPRLQLAATANSESKGIRQRIKGHHNSGKGIPLFKGLVAENPEEKEGEEGGMLEFLPLGRCGALVLLVLVVVLTMRLRCHGRRFCCYSHWL